jgi:catechol 2,3-dioxygenase-like lactoylglutathione lyase family enzyme
LQQPVRHPQARIRFAPTIDLGRFRRESMFTHIMIGSNDLKRAREFYDATFAALGGGPGETDERGRLIYAHKGGRLMITKPIDGNPATAANGGTIGIAAASPGHVLAWHEAGVAHGGTAIETPPVERPNGAFVAYLRDPDGNKLTARTRATR